MSVKCVMRGVFLGQKAGVSEKEKGKPRAYNVAELVCEGGGKVSLWLQSGVKIEAQPLQPVEIEIEGNVRSVSQTGLISVKKLA